MPENKETYVLLLLDSGATLDEIARQTGLSLEDVVKIKNKHKI